MQLCSNMIVKYSYKILDKSLINIYKWYNRIIEKQIKQSVLRSIFRKLNKYQLHAVSRTQQGRQRESSVRDSVPHFLPNSGRIARWEAELKKTKKIKQVFKITVIFEQLFITNNIYCWKITEITHSVLDTKITT